MPETVSINNNYVWRVINVRYYIINAECSVLCVQKKVRMLTVACFVFTGKGGSGNGEDADCGKLCVQRKGGMVTMVCFVFKGKAGGGNDDDADSGVLREKREEAVTKMLTVVCFVFRGKAGGGGDEDADSSVLYLRGDHHPIRHTGLL